MPCAGTGSHLQPNEPLKPDPKSLVYKAVELSREWKLARERQIARKGKDLLGKVRDPEARALLDVLVRECETHLREADRHKQ